MLHKCYKINLVFNNISFYFFYVNLLEAPFKSRHISKKKKPTTFCFTSNVSYVNDFWEVSLKPHKKSFVLWFNIIIVYVCWHVPFFLYINLSHTILTNRHLIRWATCPIFKGFFSIYLNHIRIRFCFSSICIHTSLQTIFLFGRNI